MTKKDGEIVQSQTVGEKQVGRVRVGERVHTASAHVNVCVCVCAFKVFKG